MLPFNPLDYRSCLSPLQPPPEESAWTEHMPFALALTEMLRPRTFVELGVHTGASYLVFCQAIASLGLSCSCYGVDTFAGDSHAGSYGSEIESRLRARHDAIYGSFSLLIASTFDEAVGYIGDGTIDLLHIDGLHTYEAVAHDFATWAPKLSSRGVVLFHDINVRDRGFGVWRLWEELSAKFPHFTFKHGHGLGLLAVGKEIPPALASLLQLDADGAERVADLFFLLGNRLTMQVEVACHRQELEKAVKLLEEANATIHHRDLELGRLRHLLASSQDERLHQETVAGELRREIEALKEVLHSVNHSTSFRIGMHATAPLRWVAGKLNAAKG